MDSFSGLEINSFRKSVLRNRNVQFRNYDLGIVIRRKADFRVVSKVELENAGKSR